MKYRDIGRVANAQETRTAAMIKGKDNCFYLVICSQGFVISVNLHTKETGFYPFPDGYKGYPFGSVGSRSGKVYFGAGKMFYEFDPVEKAYTFSKDIDKTGKDGSTMAWAPFEDEDGTIYFGGFPYSCLMAFNPKTREFADYGIVEEGQDYLASIATDGTGWVYCGMGTRTRSISAINLKTKERRVLINGEPNGDFGEVCLSADGKVYATLDGYTGTHSEYIAEKTWYCLYDGEIIKKDCGPFKNYYIGYGFDVIHCPYTNHPKIADLDLAEHELSYIHPESGESVKIQLEYETDGADLSPMTATADGMIYGTTNHPIQLFTYDPKTDELINYGRRAFAKHIDGWGNICAYAQQGNILAGPAYCGGFIVRIDLNEPIDCENDDTNPHCEGEFSEIFRPRSAVSMPDGKTMIFGGFNVNGKAGGGLVVYDSASRSCHVIPNEKLIYGHSVLSMVPLSDTRILCGTSIEAAFGGRAQACEAEIFEYDIREEKIIYSIVPIPGKVSIEHMKQDLSGIVHAITLDGIYFAYDPVARRVLRTTDLSQYGKTVRDGMCIDKDDTVYGLLNDGIYRVAPGAETAEIISVPPCSIERGIAVIDGKIYFGDRTHLWSYTI